MWEYLCYDLSQYRRCVPVSGSLEAFSRSTSYCETDGLALVVCRHPPELKVKNCMCRESIDQRTVLRKLAALLANCVPITAKCAAVQFL